MPGDRPALATIAAEEFRTRRRQVQRLVTAGRWTAERGNAELMPWLTIADEAGADLDELRGPHAPDVRDVVPYAIWREALARALGAALHAERGVPIAQQSAATHRIVALCVGLAVATPIWPEKEAA